MDTSGAADRELGNGSVEQKYFYFKTIIKSNKLYL